MKLFFVRLVKTQVSIHRKEMKKETHNMVRFADLFRQSIEEN